MTDVGIEPWLREILRCPACLAELADARGDLGALRLDCSGCGLRYPVVDGIPVLLVEEATHPDGRPGTADDVTRG